ncbi:1-phosphatidylinositol 4,5-bisphosphate phosphodiesterase eta-1-like isoform X1 [Myxocyprinus asiaticus]|uniref:1-phosphatidylinositol 4,5-bisphosphate phosphodiesterase eta-1-like isoform X1 n=1 Tax=Myxocyprinus asiaticus TaxID=70543 RepID=UPI0022213817|nr:1-phosphatidylinositol 4,5-bisphosphate phosphodiesterase eta-1-like isoform X1 [Myxocyprinus asiaticus]
MSYRKMDRHGSPQYCRHFLADNSIFHVERCMSVMQSGTQMVKLKNGSKGLVRLFYLDEHRSCIRWRPSRKSEKAKITIDSLYKVTEGRQSDIFHRHAEGTFDPNCCFTIYHGNHMESLDLVTSNAEEARTWVTGLRYLMAGISDEDSLAKRQRTHDQWMKQTFEEADKNGDGFLNIEEIYQLLHKMNVNLPRRKVKQMFQEADTDDQQGTLTFEEFTVFYKMMSLRRDLFLLLMCFSEKKDHLTAEELGNFLRMEQKMSNVSLEYCLDIINKFEVSEENKQKGVLGIDGFTNYMRSPVCDVFNPQHNEVNQDMDQPLCNYFIASSHNTYLTGDQLLSHSKTDMYAWVLQAGCRCVEVDCWDGPDGEPMVQHGYTLTSKITFKSVIETINKYAFVNNEFPVILSIENHCSIQQQKKIAQHLKEIFRDKLDVVEALNKDPKQLPSPNSLKGKILIKGKRLPSYLSADAEEGEVSDDDSADEIEDDFKLKNSTSNGPSQHQVESHMREKLDSLMKESQIGDKEDTDSFSIRALLRATHEGLQRNLRKNSKDGMKKSQSRSFISNLKHKRHSKSRLNCQSVETDDDGQQETSGGQFNRGGRRRKTIKLSRDLSELVVFTNSVASQECLDEGSPCNVLSFSETRAQHLVHHRAERFLTFNQRQLSRIYPSAYRIDSSNFNPQTYWNVGCQLVALNYQTEGRMMQLNRAKFMVNGGSGYVLKPGPMCKGSFNPLHDDPLPANPKKQLVIKIISGQQLPKPPDSMLGDRGEIIDPFVEVEIIGIPVDCCKEQTRVVDDNGFNPVWEETLSFTLQMPEVALVRFLVWDHDPIGRDFVGQRTVAFSSLMTGYRHVYLEGMTEASIFVHITVHEIYGKWSPLVLNPSYTIMHLLGANKGRQLRGFRGLFNKSSKSSVDTHIGVPPRKRSITDHLLRRTASAPAKGRKKTKMPLAEAVYDRKHSAGDSQPTYLERRAGNRKALQHRPASMPLEKLLQSHLNLPSPEQEGRDPGADTIIDSFNHKKPRSISMDILIETSAFKDPDAHALSADHIWDCNTKPDDTNETPYLVTEGSREHVGDLHKQHSRDGLTDKLCSSKGPAGQSSCPSERCDCGVSLRTEGSQRESNQSESLRKNVLTPKAATYSSSSSSSTSSSSCPKTPPLPGINQPDQMSQVSLQDSALSRLIDAVSLGNEYDTCGSISAMIGQFEDTAEQSTLNLFSNLQHLKHPLFNNELSSTPLKVIKESACTASELADRPSSPETTEPEVFTILDEEVLSPVSAHSCCSKNFQDDLVGSVVSKGSSPIKAPLECSSGRNVSLALNRKQGYSSQCHSTGSLRDFESGGYRETSVNSTVSDRFLLCQDSASSSLMEVEINVDGDPLDNTLTSLSQGRQWCNDFRNVQGSNQSSPYHVLRLEPSSLHKPSYHPSPVHSYSTDTSPFYRHYQSPSAHRSQIYTTISQSSHPISKSQSRNFNCYNDIGQFPRGCNRIDNTEERDQKTRDNNDLIRRSEHLKKSSLSSECLARTQAKHTSLDRDLYTPISDYDMIYSSVQLEHCTAPPNLYSQPSPHNQDFPIPPQILNGLSPASSSKVSNHFKSKSLGDLTSEDISCNFQSKYKSISRSFFTPTMQDQRWTCGLDSRPKSADPLTEQLRKLVNLEHEDYPCSFPSCSQPTPKPLPVLPLVSQSFTDDPEDPPPFLSRRLSSRSQSRVRHIANRARERQQEAFKHCRIEGSTEVVLRNKLVSHQNPPPNRHSTGSYIVGYLDQLGLEDRGLPEGACTTMRYGYGDCYYADDSVLPPDFSSPSEPEVYFLLRL